MFGHTIEQSVNDELAVPLDQVVDVAEDSTERETECEQNSIFPLCGRGTEERAPRTT